MTSAPNTSEMTDENNHDEDESPARWRQPTSLALLAAGVVTLFITKILGSLSGGPFESVADVGPRPLYVLAGIFLVAAIAV